MKFKDFSGRLKHALKVQRITIQQLSERTGIAASTIKKWTGGHSEPTLSNLVNTAQALGVQIEWLATNEGEMLKAAEHSVGSDGSTPSAAVIATDPLQAARDQIDLVRTLIVQMTAVYKAENARIATLDLFNLALDASRRIVAFTPKPERWPAMIDTVIEELRDDLRKPPVPGNTSKRSA